jgi:hypothetical protein
MPRTRVLSHQLIRNPQVAWRRGAFGIVLLPPRGEEPLTLSGTGAAVWDALASPSTESELVQHLGERFAVGSDRVRADVAPLLRQLTELGAVERSER